MSHRSDSFWCRLGWHRYTEPRGGIKVCKRDGCQKVKLWGLQGAMREIRFERELYEKYQDFTEGRNE